MDLDFVFGGGLVQDVYNCRGEQGRHMVVRIMNIFLKSGFGSLHAWLTEKHSRCDYEVTTDKEL